MKILQVTNFYFILGGGSRYFFEISQLLEKKGHKIAYFSMKDEKNIKSGWSKYFVNNISLENRSLYSNLHLFSRMIYSLEAKENISRLLDDFKPDIVHLHDFYHYLSLAIIPEFKKRNIPVVMTVHDYHIISPNRNMFHDGAICEITKPNIFYKAFLHKCIKSSYLLSIAEIIEKYIGQFLGWESQYIDYYITPSRFMKNKLEEYEMDKEKIIHLPLFVYIDKKPKNNIGKYIIYFGRLSAEKGLTNLLNVMRMLPKVKLRIVGRGSEENKLKLEIMNKKIDNVELLGFQNWNKLNNIIKGSKFSVLPSIWYENSPMSIMESFSFGKPVIASDIGGIAEIVKDGVNGWLVIPGDIEDLRSKIDKLWNNPTLCRKMGQNARKYVERNFGPEEHYEKLSEIYKMAINRHK